MTRQSLVNF